MLDFARVRELGFVLGDRAAGGESSGAWFATAPDGAPVLLKWLPGDSMRERYAALLPVLDLVRSRGVPVPEYRHVFVVDGWTVSAQQFVPGRPMDNPPPRVLARIVECTVAMTGVDCPLAVRAGRTWGETVVHTLRVGSQRWGEHEPLRGDVRSVAVLDRIEAVGAATDPAWFPTHGLMHTDLHTDNVLVADDGTLTGIIDWEDACAGDPRFDLVRFAFDLDGHDQPVWEIVEATGIELRVLRAYVALQALGCTSWAITRRPADVPRQLARAERVLDRYVA